MGRSSAPRRVQPPDLGGVCEIYLLRAHAVGGWFYLAELAEEIGAGPILVVHGPKPSRHASRPGASATRRGDYGPPTDKFGARFY